MKNTVRIAYTYGDLNKVIDRCICSDSHTQKFILLQNKQLIIEMLNILWNAQKFVAYTKEFHFEINRDEIRGYLIRKLRACDIEAVLNMIKVPAGCRSYKRYAVLLMLFLICNDILQDEHAKGKLTPEMLREVYIYGLNNSQLQGDAEFFCRLEDSQQKENEELKETIKELKTELEIFATNARSYEHSRLSNYFPLPNRIFHLGLEPGELIVYAYLMYCEDRKTFKCHPSFKTIGSTVGMSVNTVRKYVEGLEKKRFITIEQTTIKTKDGRNRNGSLEYTIRPLQEAIDYFDEVQMQRLLAEQRRVNAQRALEEYDRRNGKNTAKSSV